MAWKYCDTTYFGVSQTQTKDTAVLNEVTYLRSPYTAPVTIPYNFTDLSFWNLGHYNLTMAQISAGQVALDLTNEVWDTAPTKDSAHRYQNLLTLPVVTGATASAISTTLGNIDITSYAGTDHIELVLRSLNAQAEIQHLDLSSSYLDISSSTSGDSSVTDSLAFSTTTNSVSSGGDTYLRFPVSALTKCDKSKIRWVRIRAKATTPSLPTAPTATLNVAAGNVNGSYVYAVVFDSAGGSTTIGATSNAITAANQKIDLTNIPLGPTGTTARRVYRATSTSALYPGAGTFPGSGSIIGDGQFHLLTTISDNTTTTYTDNIADVTGNALPPSSNTAGNFNLQCQAIRVIKNGHTFNEVDVNNGRYLFSKALPEAGTTEWATDFPPVYEDSLSAKHITEVIKFNTGTLVASASIFELVLRYDIATGQCCRVKVSCTNAATAITIYDNNVQIATLSIAQLTANTDYIFKVNLQGSELKFWLYSMSGPFVKTLVTSSASVNNTILVNTRAGYKGIWFKPYNYDFAIYWAREQRVEYAEFRTVTFNSVTPVIGVTLDPKSSGQIDLLDGNTWIASGDSTVTVDTLFGKPAPSYIVARNQSQIWYGGIETASKVTIKDPRDTILSGDIYPLADASGTFRVVLKDSLGAIAFIAPMTSLVPNKWNHFEFSFTEELVPDTYTIMIHQAGFLTNSFYLDNIKLSTNSLSWWASADNGLHWQPFLNAIGSRYTAINFGQYRGSKLKFRGAAVDQSAWIQGYEQIPFYAFPGH